MTTAEPTHEQFRIGAVARLTGISTHTLRKWEERYAALAPQRGPRGERYYTREDVTRLSLMKRLVDAGTAPRELAALDLAALQLRAERLAETTRIIDRVTGRAACAVVVGTSAMQIFTRTTGAGSLLEVAAAVHSEAELVQTFARDIDVLIVAYPFVEAGTRLRLAALRRQLGAAYAVLIYDFASQADLRALQNETTITLRAPVELATLEGALRPLLQLPAPPRTGTRSRTPASDLDAVIPLPRISRRLLARIARTEPAIHCECPRQLADILLSLRAFEEYSAACENRHPEDAELHRFLWRSAAQARSLFEHAIERVAEAEGLALEES